MAITLQVPSSFACPNDDIFSLPTREDLVNAINDIAKIPGELKAEAVKLGDELSVEAQEEIDKIVEDIEKFMDKIADILSPYWKKGQTRNWQKEAKDAITEFIQEFHIYVPTKVAELISKIIPVSLKLSLFGLTIYCLRLFDPAYQKELQDQISGITKEHLAELDHLLEADADDRRLRVPAVPEAVAEAGADRDDVLERAAQLDAHRVLHGAHLERRAVEGELEEVAVGLVDVADRRLAEGVDEAAAAAAGRAAGAGGGTGRSAGSGTDRRRRTTQAFSRQPAVGAEQLGVGPDDVAAGLAEGLLRKQIQGGEGLHAVGGVLHGLLPHQGNLRMLDLPAPRSRTGM